MFQEYNDNNVGIRHETYNQIVPKLIIGKCPFEKGMHVVLSIYPYVHAFLPLTPVVFVANLCPVEDPSAYWWPTGFKRCISKAITEAEKQTEQRPVW